MLSGIYSIHRIATAAILLVFAGWLAYDHPPGGDGVAINHSTVKDSDSWIRKNSDFREGVRILANPATARKTQFQNSSPRLVNRLIAQDRAVRDRAEGVVVRSSRPLMGTTFNLSVWAPAGSQPEASAAIQDALDRVAALEGKISSWNSKSETSAVNRAAGREASRIGPELHHLLSVSLGWARKTGGAFDITGGPLFSRWQQAREEGALPTKREIRGCLELTGHDGVILAEKTVRLTKRGMRIGFGAIGKGFAADRAAARLRESRFEDFIIDAGGDILISGTRGGSPWQVAIRHPRRSGLLTILGAADCAIATSGDYEQFTVIDGIRYAHILDLRTGWPARELASVTVITQRGIDADALATGLFVMGLREGLAFAESLNDTETFMVLDDGTTRWSKGLDFNNGRLEVLP